MSKYGQAAVVAADFAANGQAPKQAWETAVGIVFPNSKSQRDKGCPRSAFLGLCETGEIRGIPAGSYTTSVANKGYTLRALNALRSNPSLSTDKKKLWSIALDGETKALNGQMDVLIGLFAEHWFE